MIHEESFGSFHSANPEKFTTNECASISQALSDVEQDQGNREKAFSRNDIGSVISISYNRKRGKSLYEDFEKLSV